MSNNTTLTNQANTAPTFLLGDGIVTTDFGSSSGANSIIIQPDGKLVAAGYSYNGSYDDFALVRYNTDGSLDTTFDGDGKVTTDFGSYDDSEANSVIAQADGKLVVAGDRYDGSNHHFTLVRYNSNGSLDTTFDGDGKVTTDFGSSSGANSVITQPDGKLVVAGYGGTYPNYDFALVRYNSDGSLDTTFDGDGKVTTDFGSFRDKANSVIVQLDGKLVVAGDSYNSSNDDGDFALVRYNTDGSLDTTFDGDGKVTTDFDTSYDGAYSVIAQADGKLVAAGYSLNGSDDVFAFALVRYNTDGSLDTTFNDDGKVTTNFGSYGLDSYGDKAHSIIIQPDGKMVVTGDSYNGSNHHFTLVRYNSNGSLDSTFGGDGTVTTVVGSSYDGAYSVIVLPGGKLVAAGHSGDFALVHYNADGSLDTIFNPQPKAILTNRVVYIAKGAATLLGTGVWIVDTELAKADNYADASLTLTRHGGANSHDVFSASGHLDTLTKGGNLVLSGVAIGTVTQNSAGTLTLMFNSNATQERVNETLSSIAYANMEAAPPKTVQIDWTFSDGNTGAQGTGGALSATGNTRVTIDHRPTIAAPIANQNTSEDAPFSFTVPVGTFADVDVGDNLSYTATRADGTALPNWLQFNTSTHTFSGTPSNSDVGSLNLRATATDLAGGSISDTFNLKVFNTYDAPTVINPIPDLSLVAGTVFSITIPADTFDVDVDHKLSYSISSSANLPNWLSYNAATRTFSGTPSTNDADFSTDIQVTAKDTTNASISDTFHLSIVVNTLPTLIVTTLADKGAGSLRDVLAHAQNGDTITFAPSLNNSTIHLASTLTLDKNVTIDGDLNNDHTPDITLSGDANHNGKADADDTAVLVETSAGVDVKLSGLTLSRSYAIGSSGSNGVNGVNGFDSSQGVGYAGATGGNGGNGGDAVAGIVNAGNLTIVDCKLTKNTALGGNGGNGGNGGDGGDGGHRNDIYGSYSYGGGGGGGGGAGGAAGNALAGIANLGVLTLSNVDFTLNIATAGQAGRGGDGGDGGENGYGGHTGGNGGEAALSEDEGGSVGNPGLAGLSGSSGSTGTTNPQGFGGGGGGGGYFGVSVVDVGGAAWTVNNPVTFTDFTMPLQGISGQSLNFDLNLTGVDAGEQLTWSASQLPDWLRLDPVQQALVGTPGNSSHGTLSLHVEDGRGGVDDLALPWRVTTVVIPDKTTAEDAAFRYAVPRTAFSDMGGALNYTAHLAAGAALPTWLKFNNGIFSGIPQNANVGVYTIAVTATNDKAVSNTDTFTLTVTNTNDTPIVAHAVADHRATEDKAFSFTVPGNTFSDADAGDHLSYAAAEADGTVLPAWLSFNAQTLTFSGTPGNSDVGSVKLGLTATDDNGAHVRDTFLLTIANANDAPVLAHAIADQHTTAYNPFSFKLPDDIFSDPDAGDHLIYTANLVGGGKLPTWLSFDAIFHKFSGTPNNLNLSPLDIKITARDNHGSAISDNFHLSITANHNVVGNNAANLLYGTDSADTLSGGGGNDTLIGGLGKDNLMGGADADRFIFNSVAETGITEATRDTLVDFKTHQGDKIDLSAIDANTATATVNNAFTTLTAGGAFSGSFANPGDLYFDKVNHILYGNNDADATADFSILLSGVSTLSAADFIL